MSDLISRGKLFNLLAPVQTLGEAYGIIQGMDTVDAVSVVRCRDCKHHHYEKHFDKRIPYCDRINYGYGWQDNDFCSHGERKDGDDGKTD